MSFSQHQKLKNNPLFIFLSLLFLSACQQTMEQMPVNLPDLQQTEITQKTPSQTQQSTEVFKPTLKEQKFAEITYHDNCLTQCPSLKVANDNVIVDHNIIILSHNINTKFADWVAYKVQSKYIKGPTRPRNWTKDPNLSDQTTLIPSDYQGLSQQPYLYDRGHQAPLAAFKNHPQWYVVNYLSNITPQKKYLNQGPWNRLEAQERKLAQNQEVYVLTGPYYYSDHKMVAPDHKRINYIIPSGYWKIISLREQNMIKTIGFIFHQNVKATVNYCDYISPISQLEHITGLKFFNDNVKTEEQTLPKKIGCSK